MGLSCHLKHLFHRQNGRCHYCRQPMWREAIHDFATQHGISTIQARQLQATVEHLQARCDGGSSERQNLVAACRFCNLHRHKAKRPLPPEHYLIRVRKQLTSGKWHRLRLIDEAGDN